jgi:hypothetical protein
MRQRFSCFEIFDKKDQWPLMFIRTYEYREHGFHVPRAQTPKVGATPHRGGRRESYLRGGAFPESL